MYHLKNITQIICRAFKNGEITEDEACRELYKHGFANYANDTNALYFYMENTNY